MKSHVHSMMGQPLLAGTTQNMTLKYQNKEPHRTFICPNDLMMCDIFGVTMLIKNLHTVRS